MSYPCGTAPLEIVQLNANSLVIHLHSVTLLSNSLKDICTLVDSGSTNCFINSCFALDKNLKTKNLLTPLHTTNLPAHTTNTVFPELQHALLYSNTVCMTTAVIVPYHCDKVTPASPNFFKFLTPDYVSKIT
jgi:hypothetical protein